MLNRKICLQCFLEAESCGEARHKGSAQRSYLVSEFKHIWLMGYCRCYKVVTDIDDMGVKSFDDFPYFDIDIKGPPPDGCPYVLEQMMSNE